MGDHFSSYNVRNEIKVGWQHFSKVFFRISWSIKCTICWKAKCHTLYGSHERTERKRKFNDYNSKQIETFLQVLLLPRDIWSLWVCLTFLSHLPVWISIFLWRHNREFVFWHPWRVVHPDCNQNWTIYKRNILFLIFDNFGIFETYLVRQS